MEMEQATTVLWCIRIPAPDDLHPAPSREAAQAMAETHNAMMHRYRAERGWTENHPLFENMLAVVEPWPWSAEAHAEALARGE